MKIYQRYFLISLLSIIIIICVIRYIMYKYNSNISNDEEITIASKIVDDPNRNNDILVETIMETDRRRQQEILKRMQIQKDICYDMQIFVKITEDKGSKDKTSQLKSTYNVKKNSSEPVIYLFILVLIYSLIKAASDITQHYNEKRNHKGNRRCSLHEYAKLKPEIKESKGSLQNSKMKQTSKSFDEFPSNKLKLFKLKTTSLGEAEPFNLPPLTEATSDLIATKSNTQQKSNFMLRRCSVPVFSIPKAISDSDSRRTSIDSSIGDDLGGSNLKRRVRMIHRH